MKDQESGFIAALTKAPESLSGLDSEIRDRTLTKYYKQNAPQLTKQIEELDGALSTSLIALKNARTAVKTGIDPKRMQEIQAKELAHQEAQEQLQESRF